MGKATEKALATASIHDLSHDGRGVARVNGKTTFIAGALPGEEVRFRLHTRRARFDEGTTIRIERHSDARVDPRCPHFGTCGGCTLQHLAPAAQIQHKHQHLAASLERIAGLQPQHWLDPVSAPPWEYRSRARFSIQRPVKGAPAWLGFRQSQSHRITRIDGCPVLDTTLGTLIEPLQALLGELERPQLMREILAASTAQDISTRAGVCWTSMADLPAGDLEKLQQFGATHGCSMFLDVANSGYRQLWPEQPTLLQYTVPGGMELAFHPWHFVQTNREVNARLINQALELLDVSPDERILDLFCGVGNFTLPLARVAARVCAVEASAELLQMAEHNARANGLENVEFLRADLAADPGVLSRRRQRYDAILLDPPRCGAIALLPELVRIGARRICYVSCDAATLARDAGELSKRFGARLVSAGILDMFPQTHHFESIALFEM